MMTLSNFVPAVYQDWYKNIIKSHKKVVADHQKKKKKKKKKKKGKQMRMRQKRMKKSVKCSFENRLGLCLFYRVVAFDVVHSKLIFYVVRCSV